MHGAVSEFARAFETLTVAACSVPMPLPGHRIVESQTQGGFTPVLDQRATAEGGLDVGSTRGSPERLDRPLPDPEVQLMHFRGSRSLLACVISSCPSCIPIAWRCQEDISTSLKGDILMLLPQRDTAGVIHHPETYLISKTQ